MDLNRVLNLYERFILTSYKFDGIPSLLLRLYLAPVVIQAGWNKLVYFEKFGDINQAIAREKQLKNWHRQWKFNLIKGVNPELRDLSEVGGAEIPAVAGQVNLG